MRFLDANIFLRHLVEPDTEDQRRKHVACLRLFEDAGVDRVQFTTCEAVVHEVLYILCSPRQYRLTHQDAADRLRPLLSMRAMHLSEKQRYSRALDLYGDYPFLDFADAMSIAHVEADGHELLSYDRDFDRVPGVKRAEP